MKPCDCQTGRRVGVHEPDCASQANPHNPFQSRAFVNDLFDRAREREKEQARLDLIGITVGGIFSCAKSLLVPEHLKDVTPEDYVKLEKIYHDLHVLQQRVVNGVDVEAEERRNNERMAKHFGVSVEALKP